ncbi:hypothetical protein [Ideonella sp.]|uniref:hypothetical protein n=1 Tax=Ideonella sp. TaxID=1929293 RepID=UPI0035B4C08C
MSIRVKVVAHSVALLGMVGASAGAFGQTYKVLEMPAGNGEARAAAIDWSGRILVNLDKPTGQTISLLCSTDGCTKLGPKGRSVSYQAMESNGDYVSYAGSAKYGDADWAIRQGNGTTEKLVKGIARGIDQDGRTVIGETAAGRAFYFDDSLHFLPTLGGERTIAMSIFDGLVGGASLTTQGAMHAMLYSIGGELVDVGVLPGGDSSIAMSARGSGYVGGCSNDAPGSSAMRPVLFQMSIEVTLLDSLYGPDTQGCVLSNHGYDSMVGWVLKPSAPETRAAIHWGNGYGWRDLNEVVRAKDRKAYTLLVANDVSPYGQIAATARRRSDGASVAVLVTPVR